MYWDGSESVRKCIEMEVKVRKCIGMEAKVWENVLRLKWKCEKMYWDGSESVRKCIEMEVKVWGNVLRWKWKCEKINWDGSESVRKWIEMEVKVWENESYIFVYFFQCFIQKENELFYTKPVTDLLRFLPSDGLAGDPVELARLQQHGEDGRGDLRPDRSMTVSKPSLVSCSLEFASLKWQETNLLLCNIWGSHIGHWKNCCPLAHGTVQSGGYAPILQRVLLPTSSGETTFEFLSAFCTFWLKGSQTR